MSAPPQPFAPQPPASARPRPRSPAELFRVFNRLSLQGFGGVLPIAQRELVERERWLTRDEFVELLSVGQVLPGPNVVNLSLMIGDRYFGLRGAFAALAGMLVVPLAIVLVLAALFGRLSELPQVAGALRGMGAVAAGLVLATAFKLAGALRRSPLGAPLAAVLAVATALLIAALRWPLPAVLAGLGGLGVLLAWRGLAR
ncbi:chromate transporter [Caldimonas tepidiphila]|uniref:chromate transporter n=1 Tax=Caldimonas tepidiphila TaxID=2315841 RepID=UPI000E5BFEAB|nr:chromate transporter [Caldimonas tepidiphila]